MANERAIQEATDKARKGQNGASQINGKATLQQYIKQMEPAIRAALPSVMTAERFSRIALSALSANPTLQECTPQSFLGAMMTAAQLGLEPNTPLGQAYLIPFKNKNKGVTECTFQIGYKGLLDLAYRSGEVSTVQAHVVYERDEFHYELGLEPSLKHIPAMSDRGAPTYVYAVFRTRDGIGYGFDVMSFDDVRAHAKRYSQSYSKDSSPWQTNFEEMAKKTLIKRVLKYAPLKSEFARGISADGTVRNEVSDDMFSVPATYIESDGEVVDASTGEVLDVAPDESADQEMLDGVN